MNTTVIISDTCFSDNDCALVGEKRGTPSSVPSNYAPLGGRCLVLFNAGG